MKEKEFEGRIDLMRLWGAYTFTNDDGVECVAVPIKQNGLYRGKESKYSIIYKFTCYKRLPNPYRQSHFIQSRLTKKKYAEIANSGTPIPIVGSMIRYKELSKFVEEKKTTIYGILNKMEE